MSVLKEQRENATWDYLAVGLVSVRNFVFVNGFGCKLRLCSKAAGRVKLEVFLSICDFPVDASLLSAFIYSFCFHLNATLLFLSSSIVDGFWSGKRNSNGNITIFIIT